MKTSILALSLALVLTITGCTSMLQQEFVSLSPHPQVPTTEENSNVVRVKHYQDLLTAILYQVGNHQELGVIRFQTYSGNVEEDLARACQEVSHEDPRGAYAVDRIKHVLEKGVYQEATITVDFRRTQDQLDQIVPVTGSLAIRSELQNALQGYASEVVLQMNYFSQDTAYVHDLIRQAYYDSPATALGMPKTTVTLYPESGLRRVAEITFSYTDSDQILTTRSESLMTRAQEIVSPMLEMGWSQPQLVREVWQECQDQLVRQTILTGSEAGRTAYDALLGNGANNEGRALALQLLCQTAGIESHVVQGNLNGDGFYWNIVQVGEVYRHMVPGRADGYALTDQQLTALIGAQWDLESYPSCAEPEPEPTPKPEEIPMENIFEENA